MKYKCPNCGRILEGECLESFLNKDCPYCELTVLTSSEYIDMLDSVVYGHFGDDEEDEPKDAESHGEDDVEGDYVDFLPVQ